MQNPTIAVINESTVVSDSDVQDLIEALQNQVDADFSQIWHVGCKLVFQDKTQPAQPGVWQLVILDNSDQAGALGYHEMTATGDPLGKVFAGEDLKYGSSWTVTASHELLEMLADPWINLTVQVDDQTLYAYEVCDACEADNLGYDITIKNGKLIHVSDFVTPEWFQPAMSLNFPFDLRGHVQKPLELLPDGYISILKINSSNGWSQLNGRFSSEEVEARSAPVEGHRRHRRSIQRSSWKKSTK